MSWTNFCILHNRWISFLKLEVISQLGKIAEKLQTVGQINTEHITYCSRSTGNVKRDTSEGKMFLAAFIVTVLLLSGVSVKSAAVNSREGDDVTLLCHNVVYPDCSSTTWIYYPIQTKTRIILINRGKIEDSHRDGKMKLQADCSLHIHNVSAVDAGLYTCQQFIDIFKHGDDAKVYLSVLTIAGLEASRALQCLLYTHEGPGRCDRAPFHTVTLRWVSDTDPPGQKDPNSQTRTDPCNSTLPIDHRRTEKDQRKWRCQLLDAGKVTLTYSYTSDSSGYSQMAATSIELPVRLTVFFLALITPPIIGAAHYMRRRKMLPKGQEYENTRTKTSTL
ncbi:uncharacterized protein LOC125714829 isoform X2 [Brienomyrus brachyistius]|uniref:uncharacterized protein LOC125714829 isoform X2 n=1 Tax=Brienomyrus brachyistius TaxID=42636 RepID=UPI0020B2BE1F|nr:uncharacterized protein LOC125714829 isoform X2 [Brienomyrus brachyistius]